MIAKLISALHQIHLEPTAEEVADILWLALQMKSYVSEQPTDEAENGEDVQGQDKPPPATFDDTTLSHEQTNTVDTPITIEQTEPVGGELYSDTQRDSDGPSAYSSSLPFKSPAAPALPQALALSRALRPLMRRVPSRTRLIFDEKATAHYIAQQYLAQQDSWMPIQHSALERWLEVALVVDESRSMAIWHQTIVEFQLLLERQGAFRDVRTWGLVKDDNEQHVRLWASIGLTADRRQLRDPGELIDPRGRRLILIVSDCVSHVWHNGAISKVLAQWGHHGPLAIIQVLPHRLWGRSGLDLAVEARIHAPSAGIPNIQLAYEPTNYWVEKDTMAGWLPIPVIPLTPEPIHHWARTVTGTESNWIPGYVFDPHTRKSEQPGNEIEQKPSAIAALTAEQRIKRFRATASPTARNLAGLLAASPISLPLVRVIQRTMLPQSEQGHVAEVFLGGLLEQLPTKCDALHPDYVQYEFMTGVRDLLLNSMPISESIQVLKEVSDFVTTQYGNTLDFRALLANPTSMEGVPINEASKPFALVVAQILSRIGGDYAAVAQHLERVANPKKRSAGSNGADMSESGSQQQQLTPVTLDTSQATTDTPPDHSSTTETDDRYIVSGNVQGTNIRGDVNILFPPPKDKDFYISYTAADRPWAEWIAWQLEEAGYTVMFYDWDLRPSVNVEMEVARAIIATVKRVLVVLSPDYLQSSYGKAELQSALSRDSSGENHIVVPVRVRPTDLDSLGPLRSIIYIDLYGLDEAAASKALLEGVPPERARSPQFPGSDFSRVEPEPVKTSPPVFPETRSSSVEPVEIYLVYAPPDELLANELEKYLSVLRRQGLISVWDNQKFNAGADKSDEIARRMNTASIILPMLSADFMASDYPYTVEMKRALDRHEAGEARVIPIILRPVDLRYTPFSKLQALPTDARPVTIWPNRDEAMLEIVRGLSKAIGQLHDILPYPQEPTVWNVPYPRNPFFTGREEVLAHLHRSFNLPRKAALTEPQAISGLGGIGKTQVAVEYAYRYRDDYQYILWVRANTRETLILDFKALAAALQLPEEKYEQDQLRVVYAVRRWLDSHSGWLLILDNADDIAMAREFLPAIGNGHILLTTRAQALGRLAQRTVIAKMTPDEGALFLLRRARFISPDQAPDPIAQTEHDIARTISQTFDGLPLALDQAGAYIEATGCSLSGYLDLYRTHNIALLRYHGSIISDHPEPVATTWSLSYQRIEMTNPVASELLRFCAFLAPDAIPVELITRGAQELGPKLAHTSDPFELENALQTIMNFSLLSRDSANNMLSIHRLVQTVLKSEMSTDEQHQWVERTVRAVNAIFPEVEFTTWPQCQHYLPQALNCADLIHDYKLTFPEAAYLLHRLGSYLYNIAQYSQVHSLLRLALLIDEAVLGLEHPDTASNLNTLGILYTTLGKFEQAEPLFQRALAIAEKAVGSNHPDIARYLDNLGTLYLLQGKLEMAEPLFQRALAIAEKAVGPNHPDVARLLNNLGRLYLLQGKLEVAEPLFQHALAIAEKAVGPNHPDVARLLNNLGRLYLLQGKLEMAEPLFQHALAIFEATVSSDHPDIAQSLNNLGVFYLTQHKFGLTEQLFERALFIYQQKLEPSHPYIAIVLRNHTILQRNRQQQDEGTESEIIAETI